MTENFSFSAAARMWNAGYDTNDMAKRYDMKESTIYNWLQRIKDIAERFRLQPEKMLRPVNYKPRRVIAPFEPFGAPPPDGKLKAVSFTPVDKPPLFIQEPDQSRAPSVNPTSAGLVP